MLKLLKSFALPAALFLLAQGLSWLKVDNELLIGMVLGLAGALFLFALLNNPQIFRRYPALADWLPYVAASEESTKMARPEDVTGSYVKNKTFRLADIAPTGRIRGVTFEDCVIHGPALITKGPGFLIMTHNAIDEMPSVFICGVDPRQRILVGSVEMSDCVLRRCRLIGVGYLALPDERERLIRSEGGDPNAWPTLPGEPGLPSHAPVTTL